MINRSDAYVRGYQAAKHGEPAGEPLKAYLLGHADFLAGRKMRPFKPSGETSKRARRSYIERATAGGGVVISVPLGAAAARSLEAGVRIHGTKKLAIEFALILAFSHKIEG